MSTDPAGEGGFNPLRREADAFRALLWFVGGIALIVLVVVLVKAVVS